MIVRWLLLDKVVWRPKIFYLKIDSYKSDLRTWFLNGVKATCQVFYDNNNWSTLCAKNNKSATNIRSSTYSHLISYIFFIPILRPCLKNCLTDITYSITTFATFEVSGISLLQNVYAVKYKRAIFPNASRARLCYILCYTVIFDLES